MVRDKRYDIHPNTVLSNLVEEHKRSTLASNPPADPISLLRIVSDESALVRKLNVSQRDRIQHYRRYAAS